MSSKITCLVCNIPVNDDNYNDHLNHNLHYSDFTEIKWFSWNENPYEFIINNAWYQPKHKNFLKNSDPNFIPKEHRERIITRG